MFKTLGFIISIFLLFKNVINSEKDLVVKYMNIEDFVRESYEYMSYGSKEIEEYKKSFDAYDFFIFVL